MGMIMIRIYVIDNGGQWTHREWRTLRDIDVDTKIVPNTTPFKEISAENVDGLVLSGGAPRIGVDSKLGNCAEYLEKASLPILGICAGHQFMARYYGGEVKPSKVPEFGKIELKLLKEDDPLFEGFEGGHDVAGDGSMILLPTPGHTKGSISMLIRQEGWHPILLVRDLTYETALLEHDVLPGTGDRETLLASFANVRQLKERLPGLAIVASHDFAAKAAVSWATGKTCQLEKDRQ